MAQSACRDLLPVLLVALPAAVACSDGAPAPGESVHRTQHAFYSGPAEPIHAEIVEDTLGFLKPSVRTYVKEVAGLGTDVAFVADSSYH
jgi:hypothetical protein